VSETDTIAARVVRNTMQRNTQLALYLELLNAITAAAAETGNAGPAYSAALELFSAAIGAQTEPIEKAPESEKTA
jgi:hypothetical protein